MDISDIRKRMYAIEKKLDTQPASAWADLCACIESLVRAVIEECFKFLRDPSDVTALRKAEDEIGRGKTSFLNFGFGDLKRIWSQAQIPMLWGRIPRPVPAIFKSFPFTEFVDDRNPGIHHGHTPPATRLKRLYYSAIELLDGAFPLEGWSEAAASASRVEGPRHNIPRREHEFVGRDAEIRKILGWLDAGSRGYLVSITGVGGVGKSALAAEVARRCMGDGPLPEGVDPEVVRFDACVWTSAKEKEFIEGRVRPRITVKSNLSAIVSEVIRVAGAGGQTQEGTEAKQLELASDILRKRRILLVVDNMETIDDDDVLAFLNSLPQPSKVIVTDRRSVMTPQAIQLLAMDVAEARRFVRDHGAARDLELSDDQVGKLVQRTGGIPLAMIWALGLMSQSGLGAEAVFRRLSETGGRPLLDFMFDESFNSVSEVARLLLAACSLSPTAVKGAQLADWAELGPDDAEDGLGELQLFALVQRSGAVSASGGILQREFTVLPLTRDFIRTSHAERLSDDLRKRASRQVIASLLEAERSPDWPMIATVDAVEANRDLLSWAMDDAFQRADDATVLDGIRIAGYSLGIRGWHLQRRQLAELALKAAIRSNDHRGAARCLVLNIAWVEFGWYAFDESERTVREGMRHASIAGDRLLGAVALRMLGLLAKERADRLPIGSSEAQRVALQGEASGLLHQALTVFHDLDDPHFIAITHGSIGSLLRDEGRFDEAEAQLKIALNVARQLDGAEEIHSIMCQKLSRILARSDARLEEAEALNLESMAILSRLRRPAGVAHCKRNQALIEERRGNVRGAIAYVEEANEIFHRVGSKEDVERDLLRLRAKAQGSA